FKTPIVSIRGFAELLSKSNLSEEQKKEYVSVILEESVRLSTLAENSLSLSRVESLNILTGVTEYNVSEQIRACLLLLENKWSVKNLDLKVDFNEFAVNANEELLKQVWINLLDNAIKFSKDGGVIEINLKMENNKLSVSIINEGIEISEYDKTKIFDKFYRSEKSKFIEGSGVGLAIVKKIVSLHGGEIAVNSIDGKTCFTVTLKSAKVI
ncbi:MAG: HAMP domain-containing histidine kinase, partial [Clostridia bacterium]|nr:HAMP domain-containing histidine kinase [Clostridia bacterium]